MVLCQCVGVTDVTIKQLIEEGATSVGDITRRCGAGRCCTPCREEIAALVACHGGVAGMQRPDSCEPIAPQTF